MSYRPPTITSDKGVFYGYRNTSVAITTDDTIISLTNASTGNTVSGGSISFGSTRKYYAAGEVRVTSASGFQLSDIKIVTNSGESAEGYQVRNNANGTVLCDDACYGIASQSSVSLYVADVNAPYGTDSDANETRIIGVFTS